jgi:hypothetical protein
LSATEIGIIVGSVGGVILLMVIVVLVLMFIRSIKPPPEIERRQDSDEGTDLEYPRL